MPIYCSTTMPDACSPSILAIRQSPVRRRDCDGIGADCRLFEEQRFQADIAKPLFRGVDGSPPLALRFRKMDSLAVFPGGRIFPQGSIP